MKKFSYSENACIAQRFLFRSVMEQGFDILDFAKQFLTSSFCERDVDDWRGRFHQELFLKVVLGACNGEITPIETDQKQSSSFGEMGYVYRMLCEITKIPSKELVSKISPEEMNVYCMELDELTYEDLTAKILKEKGL